MTVVIATRDRRAVIAGIAVVALALITLRGVSVARSIHAGERGMAMAEVERLANARQVVATRSRLADSLERLNALWEAQRLRLFDAPTVNGVTAQIASYVSRVARNAPVEIRSLQVRADTLHRDGFRRMNVNASARGDIAGLMSLISTLENGSRRFRIASLTVSQPDVTGRASTAEALGIEISLTTLAIEPAR